VLVRILVWWATNLAALWVAAALLDAVDYGDLWALVLAALVFGLVNLVVRPVLVLLALPAVILTLGVALLFINAAMLLLTEAIVPGFDVDGFWWAVLAALVVWVVNMLLHALIADRRSSPRRSLVRT
jgi:putative membrane protein